MQQQPTTLVDVAVIGAGTVGLATAAALLAQGLSVTIIDPRPASALMASEYDGRDVALSSGILSWLETLGVAQHLAAHERSPIRGARIIDTEVSRTLTFPSAAGTDRLGEFIPEHCLRNALYAAAGHHPRLTIYAERRLQGLATDSHAARLTLDDGMTLQAALVVAADGRGSRTRALLGIGQRSEDQGFDMLCCRVEHATPHDQWTVQQFDEEGSIATLPLNAQQTSLALMLPPRDADRLIMMTEGTFCAYLDARLRGRLGTMTLSSLRYRVPLSGSYAERFHGQRAVLLGDAAVGMLPITAHGLNLGLIGARSLAAEIGVALGKGEDIGSDRLTRTVSRRAQLTARPLYVATQEIARLFTRHDAVSRKLRQLTMAAGHPFQALVSLNCTQRDPRQVPWVGALKDSLRPRKVRF